MEDLEKLQKTAVSFLKAVSADTSDENLQLVYELLKEIVISVNDAWEDHISKQTDEVLARDKVTCPGCNAKIDVTRKRTKVGVKLCLH